LLPLFVMALVNSRLSAGLVLKPEQQHGRGLG
jgi:hypothetical protein